MMPKKSTTPATSSSRKPELVGRVAAAAKSSEQADGAPREPNLHPVLGAVNKGTIFLTSTPVLNAFKSWFWGLFAGERLEEEKVESKSKLTSVLLLLFFVSPSFLLSFSSLAFMLCSRFHFSPFPSGTGRISHGEQKKKHNKKTLGSYDEEEVAAELEELIASAPVVVFAWSFSPFSKNARELLDTIGASYEAVELDRVPRGFALKKELSKLTGRSSVPNVFIKGESVGGCYDGPGVVPLYRSGELQEKLRRAGALKKEQKQRGWSFF
jgi:glutaredoxin 3